MAEHTPATTGRVSVPEQHIKRLICHCGLRATITSSSPAMVEGIVDLVMREHPCDDEHVVAVIAQTWGQS